MPKLTVNGKEVEVPAGTNLIEAAHALRMPSGSLGVSGELRSDSMHSYVFGGRFSPNASTPSRKSCVERRRPYARPSPRIGTSMPS